MIPRDCIMVYRPKLYFGRVAEVAWGCWHVRWKALNP